MQKSLCYLLLILCLGMGSGRAQEPSPRDKFHRISQIFKEAIAQGEGPGASVCIYYKGIQYFQGFGTRESGQDKPVNAATLFKTASTSKVLVAYAILKLEKSGELSLLDPLSKFFPEIGPELSKINLKQLLSHTAGLEDRVNDFGPEGESQHIPYLKGLDESIIFAPAGEVFSYSNPGYNILGAIIERLTRLEFQGAMSTLVFQDFAMQKSTYDPQRADLSQLAWGHHGSGDQTQKLEKLPDNAQERASGMLISNVQDYIQFLAWLADEDKTENADLRQKLREIISPPEQTGADWSYGLGLFHQKHCGYNSLSHSGGLPGYRANFVLVPEEKFAMAVFTNGSSLNRSRLISQSTEIMFNRDCEEPSLEEEELRFFTQDEQNKIVGTYAQSVGAKIVVYQEGGKLRLSRDSQVYSVKKDAQGRIAAMEGEKVIHRFTPVRDISGKVAYLQNWVRAYPRVE